MSNETRIPKSWDDVCPSRWLKAEHLPEKPQVVLITKVYQEKIESEWETILQFRGTDKELGLNVTNKLCLREMFGRRPAEDWPGKRIVLVSEIVDAFGERKPAVRIAGSPDIAADVRIDMQLSRRSRLKRTLKKWPNGTKGGAKP